MKIPNDEGGLSSGFLGVASTAPVPSGAQSPPAGFQILEGYTFRTPGQYRMAVFFTQEVRSSFIRPHYDRLPKTAYGVMYWLSFLFGLELRPSQDGPEFAVDVQSNTVEFTVKP